jgi:hypothetical protein
MLRRQQLRERPHLLWRHVQPLRRRRRRLLRGKHLQWRLLRYAHLDLRDGDLRAMRKYWRSLLPPFDVPAVRDPLQDGRLPVIYGPVHGNPGAASASCAYAV